MKQISEARARTSCLGVLTTDTETPEVTETTVRTDLLEALQVVTELRVDTVGKNLRGLAVNNVPLPVQEPHRDLELRGVLDDGNETLELIRVKLASAVGTDLSSTLAPASQNAHTTYRLFRSTSAFLQTRLA